MVTNETMNSMMKYVHQKDTSILGNFNNIKRDYEEEHGGKSFSEVVSMIDNGEVNDTTNDFRIWSCSWFWDTFGTYNMCYNFSNYLCDIIDDLDQEEDR